MLTTESFRSVSNWLSLEDYLRLIIASKSISIILKSDIFIQHLFHRYCPLLENNYLQWENFQKSYGSWNMLKQGYFSHCRAETACYPIEQVSGPKMKFAWGPTCGNYWKKKTENQIRIKTINFS